LSHQRIEISAAFNHLSEPFFRKKIHLGKKNICLAANAMKKFRKLHGVNTEMNPKNTEFCSGIL